MSGQVIVTGGAGFIGSCIVSMLNQKGVDNILVIDEDLNNPLKLQNLSGKKYSALIHKDKFLDQVKQDRVQEGTLGIFHMGACSSTTEGDADYLRKNNLEYSQALALWSMQNNARFIYASSAATYGDGEFGYSDDPDLFGKLKPMNLYGHSKLDFDKWAKDYSYLDKIAGFRFFNVFGPNEQHKGDMQSLISKAHQQILETGRLKLFKSHHPDWKDGESVRDFIYIKDVLKVLWLAWEKPSMNGVFNLGTGQARSWNDLAAAVFSAMDKEAKIDFVDMPMSIRDKYQYHTQADMTRTFEAAGSLEFEALEKTVTDYVQQHLLLEKNY